MKGKRHNTRQRNQKKTPREKNITSNISCPGAKKSNVGPRGALSTFLPSTPKRTRRVRGQAQEVHLTSTPVHSSSKDCPHPPHLKDEVLLNFTDVITKAKTSDVCLPGSNSKSLRERLRNHSCNPRQARPRAAAASAQTQVNGSTPKRKRGRPQKTETENFKKETATQQCKVSRPRFELQKPDASGQDESLLSSDLSIELSHCEEQPPPLSFQVDEKSDDEEEEELPSFLMQKDKKPSSITEGAFVWCKFRHYPFWPAWVKCVNRKHKKASIIFVDEAFTGSQGRKGFAVALKSLKPFDCEEADKLMCKAKEEYDAAVTWSMDLIEDYRIRIACGSFSGSFVEYFNHDMSYPVRRMYPQAASQRLTIASDTIIEEPCDDHQGDSLGEKQEDVCTSTKRLLPDRTHAAHNRANEKLVHFIVKQRMVEAHLLAVIRGQQQSRWLRSFKSANRRRVVNIYLEDDKQLDQVYWYLNELYASAVAESPCLTEVKSMEQVPFVLDVLLPEAIIYAIAGVDNISVKKAEEKYLKGRCISNRERQEFDLMIERQMRRKRQNAALDFFSDPIS